MKFNIIFLFFSFIIKIECYIKIPFTYFKAKSYEDDDPKSTILSILDLKMFGLLEIGTPKQLCQIPINFGSNTFFIPEKSSFHYDIKDNIYLYDNRNSSSFLVITDEDTYEGENFIDAYYVKDLIYFEEKKFYIEFYLSSSYFYPQLGGLGLQLYPSSFENTATPDIDKTFFRKLKKSGIINNYIWSIFYNQPQINHGETNGYILIGDYPHLSNNYQNNKSYNFSLNYIDAEVYNNKIVETKFLMHNAQLLKNENDLIDIDKLFFVKLDYNFGGIKIPEKLKIYFENNVFKNLNFCNKEKLSLISNNIFYYCYNNENTINKLKNYFPKIKLDSKILNNSFIINIDNLLYIKGSYIYILLIFEENSEDWTLGIPFLQEYQFSINEDSKKIYFYKKIEISKKEEKNENNKIYLILIIILLASLFISGISFGIFLYYKNNRKKRKNELDDNFDYTINDAENNAIIN